MVVWPAVLKYRGDHELTFVLDQSVWNSDTDLHFFGYDSEDILIDSEGSIFALSNRNSHDITLGQSGRKIELESMLELIKAHESQLGACCTSKLSFQSIAEAIMVIGENNKG
ncbi:MAG: hypothetical protein ACJAUP_002344 [Cellvibrionaceae bacterium]|jgi:hypothetical protein